MSAVPNMSEKRVVVLISGSGSNLQAFIDAQQADSLGGKIVAVLSNKADAYGLQRAQQADIPTKVISHLDFASREEFDDAMARVIVDFSPDIIVLAGFMRILSEKFVHTFQGKLLNIHPSLLPKYPGLHTHRRALENKDEYHGSSVHFVTEELDGGPVIGQARLLLNHKQTESEVMQQVQKLEHQLYPKVVSLFLTGKLSMENDGVYFDKEKLEQPLLIENS